MTPHPVPSRSLRLDRALARLPRTLAALVAAVLIAAGLHSILAGRPASRPAVPAAAPDLALHGYAAEIATRYLSFDARDPQRRTQALRALVGDGLGADLGLEPAPRLSQHVRSARVVQDQPSIAGGRLITVAVDTDRHGLLDVSLPIRRGPDGRLRLAGYPALIGTPQTAPAQAASRRAVTDAGLRTVARRAVVNYLARDAADLQADLAPGAHVALPALALSAEAAADVAVAGPGGVDVTVHARDADGVRYTLTYELGVVRRERWYVSAVQAFPNQP